jgi:hypothetical protein
MKGETENKIVQLKKEEIEIKEGIALSEAVFVKSKQEEEVLQADCQKVWCQELGIDQTCRDIALLHVLSKNLLNYH